MKRMRLLSIVAVCLCLFFAGGAMAASVPMPDDIRITPPDPALPKELADLSGTWQGSWYNLSSPGGYDAALIIEDINERRAVAVYCWGDSPQWNLRKGCTRRFPATVSKVDGKYILSWFAPQAGTRMEFSLNGKTLEGFESKHGNRITMKRMP